MKSMRLQMRFKAVSQFQQLGRDMIVTDRPPGLLPDLLLGVQVGRGGRKFHKLQARVGRQQVPDSRTPMPRGAVPKHDHPLAGMPIQNLLQVLGSGEGIQVEGARDEFLAGPQVQAAVERDFAAARVDPHDGRLTHWRPNRHDGRLQIHPGFIFGEVDGVWVVLR